ncbi:hypothetical protein [Arsenophonus nasoniae]|uniref:hypothetical protein n=1 Tax=Arsenophonus nasoniae TaxID=638 RepID=UPI0038794467
MRVYKTNIAGIGYALGINSMCGKMLFPSKGWINNLDATSTCWTSGRWDPITHKFAIRIYKIGPTGNGEVAMRMVGASNLFYDDTKSWAKENLVFLNSFKVTTIGNNNSGGQGSNNGGGQANNNSGGQGSNNGGGQANNNSGGHGSNNGGEQGNNNWNGQDNRNRGSQGNNNGGGQGGNQNNNNSVWPNGDLNNNSVWPNGSVNNNVNNNSHRNDHN